MPTTGGDAWLLARALAHGRLVTLAPAPGPAAGAEVGIRLLGGVSFPR